MSEFSWNGKAGCRYPSTEQEECQAFVSGATRQSAGDIGVTGTSTALRTGHNPDQRRQRVVR